jgi:hypothetical protein
VLSKVLNVELVSPTKVVVSVQSTVVAVVLPGTVKEKVLALSFTLETTPSAGRITKLDGFWQLMLVAKTTGVLVCCVATI